jgi:transposase
MTLYNQRRHAGMVERRAEARRLQARGLTRREIAQQMDCSRHSVNEYLWRGSAPAAGLRGPMVGREEKAQAMAAVYPDDERRDWIYRQMGVERDADLPGEGPTGRHDGL